MKEEAGKQRAFDFCCFLIVILICFLFVFYLIFK